MDNILNPMQLPTTTDPELLDQSINQITIAKAEVANVQGRATDYIKAKVAANRNLWWSALEEDLRDSDPKIRRAAMIEYNKLQVRILPTELSTNDSGGILVQVMGYGASEEQNTIQDAEFIESTASDEV